MPDRFLVGSDTWTNARWDDYERLMQHARRWLAVDLVWAISAGVGIGWLCGTLVGRAVVRLRRGGHPMESEEFLLFGVIALAYGLALWIGAYGFLAVFATGVMLGRVERQRTHATDPSQEAPMSARLIDFTAQSERLAEVAIVLLIGAALAWAAWSWLLVAFAVIVLAVVRPLSVLAVVPDSVVTASQRRLIGWFGIRGVGSVYYLCHAAKHGLDPAWAHTLGSAVLITIALSILAHGISATPLMERYRWRRGHVA
jgi:NhaP-type Na+/H+ or K+/H+ antiporter